MGHDTTGDVSSRFVRNYLLYDPDELSRELPHFKPDLGAQLAERLILLFKKIEAQPITKITGILSQSESALLPLPKCPLPCFLRKLRRMFDSASTSARSTIKSPCPV
jgi:hypothetical protein